MDAPKPKAVYYEPDITYSCSSNSTSFQSGMMWSLFAYNSVFVLAGAFLAFKTRNVATDFNESKYIAFAIYSVMVISVLFVPIISITGLISPTSKFVLISMMILIITSFTVLTLFIPKIYQVWFYVQSTNTNLLGVTNRKFSIEKNPKVSPQPDPDQNQLPKSNNAPSNSNQSKNQGEQMQTNSQNVWVSDFNSNWLFMFFVLFFFFFFFFFFCFLFRPNRSKN